VVPRIKMKPFQEPEVVLKGLGEKVSSVPSVAKTGLRPYIGDMGDREISSISGNKERRYFHLMTNFSHVPCPILYDPVLGMAWREQKTGLIVRCLSVPCTTLRIELQKSGRKKKKKPLILATAGTII
jgi:hypothetical protein